MHALVCLLLSAAALAADPGELVSNGDFSARATGRALPDGWTAIGSDGGREELTVVDLPGGGHAVRIAALEPGRRWGPGLGQTGIGAKAGQWYRFRFRARSDRLRSGEVFAALRDVTDWPANLLWTQRTVEPAWTDVAIEFQASRDLDGKNSRLQVGFDGGGALLLTGLSLVPIEPPPPPPPPNLVSTAGRPNRLPNGGFECGLAGWGTSGADGLIGTLDHRTAAEGPLAYRLDLSEATFPRLVNDFEYSRRATPTTTILRALPLANIGYLPVEPNQPFTLSAALKAEPEGLPVTLRVRAHGQPTIEQTFTTTKDWARYSLPFRPAGAAVCVQIEARLPDGQPQAMLWVDAVRVAPGEAREYVPAFPVEAGVSTGREGNWYRLGEAVAPSALLANGGAARETVTLRWWCTDFFGQTGAERRETLTLAPGTSRALPLATQITEAGFFRLHTVLTGTGWEQRREDRLAVILPLRDDPEQLGFLGLNHPFVSDLFMRIGRRLGVGWARLWAAKWNDVEPEQGHWTFAETDAQLERNADLGYRTLLCLATPSAGWASSAPADVTGITEGESEPQRHWWRPRSFADYTAYATAVVRRYRGRVHQWEVFNEPIEVKGGPQGNLDMAANYLRFLNAVRDAVEREDPDGAVLGCGLGYLHSQPELDAVLRRMNILSEHRYPGLSAPGGFQDDLDETVARLHRANPIARIWITEYGVYADDDPDPTTLGSRFMVQAGDQSERKAAVRVAQHLVCARAAGVETVFFHIGNWPFLVNFEHGCGFHPFFEYGGVPRKTGVAVNAAAWHLAGAKPVARPASSAELTAYEFRRGGTTVFVLWSVAGEQPTAALRRALAAPGVTLRQVDGGRVEPPLRLADTPLYVSVTDPAAAAEIRRRLTRSTQSGPPLPPGEGGGEGRRSVAQTYPHGNHAARLSSLRTIGPHPSPLPGGEGIGSR